MICEVGMFQEGHSRACIPTLLSICLDVELTGKGKLRSKRSQWYALFDSTYTKIYSLVAQTVKSAYTAGDPGSILGQEDTLEKERATHSSILAWRIPWTEEPGLS